MLQIIINIIVFLLILTVIITIHEFGHFITAKLFGVYCGAFSIGMGPKLFGHKGKETEFQIRAIPIGGFVTMAGEDDQEENPYFHDVPRERTLKGKKTYQKVIIFLAGIFMNFVLAIIIMFALNTTVGMVAQKGNTLGTVVKDSAAEKYGLKAGDKVTQIVNTDIHKTYTIKQYSDITKALVRNTKSKKSVIMKVTVVRNGKTKVFNVKAPVNSDTGKYYLGVSPKTRKMSVGEAFTTTFSMIGTMSLAIFRALEQLIINFTGTVKQMSGPVGIYNVTAQVTQSGDVANIFYLTALLSVNIGIFNLLPIPGLDGAQTLFAIIEGIIRRELPQRVKLILQAAGLSLILLLMVVVTYQDILKLM
jgi:regulator of sigma E protease